MAGILLRQPVRGGEKRGDRCAARCAEGIRVPDVSASRPAGHQSLVATSAGTTATRTSIMVNPAVFRTCSGSRSTSASEIVRAKSEKKPAEEIEALKKKLEEAIAAAMENRKTFAGPVLHLRPEARHRRSSAALAGAGGMGRADRRMAAARAARRCSSRARSAKTTRICARFSRSSCRWPTAGRSRRRNWTAS